MELLIGREADTNQLAVMADGKPFRIDVGASVPNTVSRCLPAEHTAHCRISVSTEKGMRIENLNPRNATYVNGAIVNSCRISGSSRIELGPDLFRIDLHKILKAVGYNPEYSIRHLKQIWDDYDQALLNLQLEQQKNQNRQRLQGILSQLSMLCVIIPAVIPAVKIPDALRVVLVLAAVCMAGYFFWKGSRPNETFVMKKRELDKQFKQLYVCPNPKCAHFLGFVPYDTLQYRKKCSDCGSSYKS